MRHFLTSLLLAAVFSAAAFGDTPKAVIKGPSSVDAGATIVLDARGSVADKPLRWKIYGPDVPFLVLDQDGRQGVIALIPAAPAGTYRFTLIAKGTPTGQTELDADAAMLVVEVNPLPAPSPVPTPTPAPTPAPNSSVVTGTLHATLVVDLDTMTPDLAQLREGINARAAFKTMDTNYRTLAANSAEVDALRLGPYVTKAGGAPALIIQDARGNVLSATKAPANEDALIAAVKKFRGTAP